MEISRSARALRSESSQLLLHRQFGIRDIAGFWGPDQLTNPLFRRFANTDAMRSAASNPDSFNFIEGNVVASPIVKLGGSRGLMIGDMLSHFELASAEATVLCPLATPLRSGQATLHHVKTATRS